MVNSFSLGLYLNNASIVEDSLNRLYDATVVCWKVSQACWQRLRSCLITC